MDKVLLPIKMEIAILEELKMEKNLEKEIILQKINMNIGDNLRIINFMEKDKLNFKLNILVIRYILANFKMEKCMAMEN